MRTRLATALLSALLPYALAAQSLSITPRPASLSVQEGSLALTKGFNVSYGSLPDSLAAEARLFVSLINAATGLEATASEEQGLVTMEADPGAADEGYSLTVAEDGVRVKARTAAGFFYAFQTLRKMLPPNVMALVADTQASYALPLATVSDAPRFPYRGFMLDVSRHFFPLEEVKRMVDLMATYKMNRFHWHLTDDQGWRAEIRRYPLLTSVGATASNCRVTDIDYGTYWTNEQYGPFFYTQEEMRELVEYCRERHIEVIPEIEMPGHMVAAMASYPEYSCTPANPPAVWTTGGVSSNVLNVGNTQAVQFAKNILTEICDIFPSPYIHIGGDECPTTQWESNSLCQTLKEELGLDSYRALQSHFTGEICAHLASLGKRAIVWNESISASGADTDLFAEYKPVVMCWSPCQSSAAKAASMGLENIVTEYHSSTNGLGGGYYINRKQSADPGEPDGAGDGNDSVEGCYAYVPVPASTSDELLPYYTGVQATFWCEWVANAPYLEYLALPRLMAVAEAGWTQQSAKDFDDFRERMAADTLMLNLAGYNYGRHIFAAATEFTQPDPDEWYTLRTLSTDARAGSCIELISDDSPLTSQHSANGAQPWRLWEDTVADEEDSNRDCQLWSFREETPGTGLYAMVCKAQPEGSVDPTPTAVNNTGRWDYDLSSSHYGFSLADAGWGLTSKGNSYCTIRASQLSGWYMNAALSGQGYAINLWNDPSDGNSGLWELIPSTPASSDESSFDQELFDALPRLATRDTIQILNAVEGYEGVLLADKKGSSYLTWQTDSNDLSLWVAYDVTDMDYDYCQQAVLRNLGTKRYACTPEASSTGNVGYPVTACTGYSAAPLITLQYQPATGDCQLLSSGRNLYPVSLTSATLPGIVSSGNTANSSGLAVRPQGAGWTWRKVSSANSADGIASPQAPQTDSSAVYTLAGQLVAKPSQPGIYIVGRRKVMHR